MTHRYCIDVINSECLLFVTLVTIIVFGSLSYLMRKSGLSYTFNILIMSKYVHGGGLDIYW